MKSKIKVIKKYDVRELEEEANQLLEEGWKVRAGLLVQDGTFYLMLIRSVR